MWRLVQDGGGLVDHQHPSSRRPRSPSDTAKPDSGGVAGIRRSELHATNVGPGRELLRDPRRAGGEGSVSTGRGRQKRRTRRNGSGYADSITSPTATSISSSGRGREALGPVGRPSGAARSTFLWHCSWPWVYCQVVTNRCRDEATTQDGHGFHPCAKRSRALVARGVSESRGAE